MIEKKRILIVDDHLLIIDGYRNALKFGFSHINHISFEIDFAVDCDSAIKKIETSKKNKPFDIIILDLSLPKSKSSKINSGEDLGLWIKSELPEVKLIVITGFDSNIKVNYVLKQINPIGFLLKKEMSSMDLVSAIGEVLENRPFFSPTVTKNLRQLNSSTLHIDDISTEILVEISNGTRTKDMHKYIHLSMSSIEKKKKSLKKLFKVETDRDLILKAKAKGFL